MIRNLHDFTGKFKTVMQLKDYVTRELKEELPIDSTIDVGYFDGRQSSRVWLVSTKDLESMYKGTNEIFLWIEVCKDDHEDDSNSDNPGEPAQKKRKLSKSDKKKKQSGSSRRQQKEDEVEAIYDELKSKHCDNYTSPQLKLWARMIHIGTHDDYEDPPRVPMITGTLPTRSKKDSFTEAITGAAEAVAKALSPPPPTPVIVNSTHSVTTGISPGKSTELRTKNLQQLRLLQQLYEENVISDKELTEQKSIVLDALRKLV